MNKPLHPSTNPVILVKIGPLGFELPGLENRPLKYEEKIGKVWLTFYWSMHHLRYEETNEFYLARSAKLPEGLYILPMFFLYFFNFF